MEKKLVMAVFVYPDLYISARHHHNKVQKARLWEIGQAYTERCVFIPVHLVSQRLSSLLRCYGCQIDQ